MSETENLGSGREVIRDETTGRFKRVKLDPEVASEMGKARWQVLSVAGDDGKAVVVAEAVAAAFGNALDRGLPAEDVPIANLRLGQAHR